MAMVGTPANDRKRVKVYELKNNDWFDRGTGFCTGQVVNDEARIFVQSEDEPTRILLETRILKDDGYQKQQDTLIVWTEQNVTDMALSFQEAEGCAAIWDFVQDVQQRMQSLDDGLSDDVMDSIHPIMLPAPELANLPDVENVMRNANTTPQGRDALAKFIVQAGYIAKLVPLVEMAEDFESIDDLHRLCNVMKTLILLNDTAIIEYVVTDEVVLGVVGALEYDPDFPCHKANHRQYLQDESRFKEVVKIEDLAVKKKIHYTYRLQYLKDVVLARILDDPTFSVLNSLIFFHQVDIVQHLQGNATFLKELFGIFAGSETDVQRKKDAVHFIQQCCAVAKSLQAQSRAQLYQNFIAGGLFQVITFALRHHDASVRVAGTDILVALIDHDALMMRSQIFKSVNEKTKPLTDTLIELLLVETDLGVKSQMADAIKVLLDPNANTATVETLGRTNPDFLTKMRNGPSGPQTESFIQNFYDESARKLFQPLKELEKRDTHELQNLTFQEVSLYSHLVDTLSFFIRQHSFRSKYFVLSEGLASRVAQLMSCPEKHLKLAALKYFRNCIALHDEFHNRQMTQNRLFDPILNIVFETMPRDNLLNSACLELFEFIRRENIHVLMDHIVENYRDKLVPITYVDTFSNLIIRYDQLRNPHDQTASSTQDSTATQQATTPRNAQGMNTTNVNGGRWQGLKEADAEQEAYFEGDDHEEDELSIPLGHKGSAPAVNGASPVRPLVDYPDDEDERMDLAAQDPSPTSTSTTSTTAGTDYSDDGAPATTPPSDGAAVAKVTAVSARPPEKRRREDLDDDEDELGKLSAQAPKRRPSASSLSSNASATSSSSSPAVGGSDVTVHHIHPQPSPSSSSASTGPAADASPAATAATGALRRKKGLATQHQAAAKAGADGGKKIAISLSVKGDPGGGGGGAVTRGGVETSAGGSGEDGEGQS